MFSNGIFFICFFTDNIYMETSGTKIVDRIDGLLKDKNLKRQAIYDITGISPNSFSNWAIRGTIPAADTAIKIAHFLGVSVEWLVTGKDPNGLSEEEQALLSDYHDITDTERPIIRQQIHDAAERGREAKKDEVNIAE